MISSRKGLVRKEQLREEVVPVSSRTLDWYIKRRIVPFYKIGRVVMFDPDEVLRALKAYERKAAK